MQMLELNYVISSSVDSIGTVSIIFHVWLTSLLLFWFWRFFFNCYCFFFCVLFSLLNTFCVMAQFMNAWARFFPSFSIFLSHTHRKTQKLGKIFCWFTFVSGKLFPLNIPKWKWRKYFYISIYHNDILKIG